jgi:ferredoxin-NADP reductase
MAHPRIDVKVAGVRQLTPRICEYELRAVAGVLPPVAPGAHVELHTGDARSGPIVRHYSLIGGSLEHDDPRDTCRVAVQREDHVAGSAYIHQHFEPGTRLQVSAPINLFPLDRRDANSLLIAGGIGITPIFSMARSLQRRRREFSVVYTGRAPAAMAYHDELLRLGGARVRCHHSGAPGAGRLDLPALFDAQPPGTTAYVCGPASLVVAAQAAAAAAGWPADRVRSERFGAGRSADDMAFDVELRRSGRVVRVGRHTSILDALTAARIDVLSDCRRGECGLCPQTVLDADGPIDHRDRYLSDADKAAGHTLCICVSRIRGQRLVLDL